MAPTPAKPKKSNKPPKGRPAATSGISQPAVEDASPTHSLSSFSPNGELFAYVSLAVDKHRLRVYDSTSGRSVAEHVVDGSRVSSLCWARFDASQPIDGGSKRKKKRKNKEGDAGSSKPLPQGVLLGLTNGSLVLFSPGYGKVAKSISHPTSTTPILAIAVDEEDDEKLKIWTSGADGVLRLWSLRDDTLIDSWKSEERTPYSSLAIMPDLSEGTGETRILAAHHAIQLLGLFSRSSLSETPKPIKLASFTGHASSINGLYWDTSSTFLSIAEADRFVYLWEIPPGSSSSNGQVTASMPLDSDVRIISLALPPRSSTSASTKTQTLLALSASGRISIFSLPTGSSLPSPSNSRVQVPTLSPSSNISAPLPKNGISRAQVIGAAFVTGEEGKIRVVQLANGVRPVFDVVDYLDPTGGFIQDVSLPLASTSAHTVAETEGIVGAPTVRYIEPSSVAIRSGIELGQEITMDDPSTHEIEGELDIELAELSLGQRLTALGSRTDDVAMRTSSSDDEGAATTSKTQKDIDGPIQVVPASSLTQTLIQALHSSDSGLLETCLAHTNVTLIHNTVRRLPAQLAVPLVMACVERLGRGKRVGRGKGGGAGAGAQRGTGLVRWVKAVLVVHGGHLLTIPDLVARLSGLHQTLTARLALQESLLSLSGKLDMVISQIELRSSTGPAPLPMPKSSKSKGKERKQRKVKKYVEGESESESEEGEGDREGDVDVEVESEDEEGSIEDVELGGDEDVETDGDRDSAEEEDEEEDDSDDSGGVNGFIDDEAEEYSSDEEEDESE